MGAKCKEMNGKSLVVDLKIPAEEVENIDELVRAGYYGSRSDAIRDVIRRGAAQVRARYPVCYGHGNQGVGAEEQAKRDSAPALTARVQAYI